MNPLLHISKTTKNAIAALAGLLLSAIALHGAAINFITPVTLSADTDVSTTGTLVAAYSLNTASVTLNGVPFAPGNASVSSLGTNFLMTGFASHYTAFGGTSLVAPFANLSTSYRSLMSNGIYVGNLNATPVVTLTNLTFGHRYAVQIWGNNSRTGYAASDFANVFSTGGNNVDLYYNSTGALGGVGQFTIGTFTADGPQPFTIYGNKASGQPDTYMNAIQLRDLGPDPTIGIGYWNGLAGNSVLDYSSLNFCTNLDTAPLGAPASLTSVEALTNACFFSDSFYSNSVPIPVTASNLTVAAGGVSIGTLNFMNSHLTYTLNSADANGITGGTIVNKSGGGTLILEANNTYIGGTVIAVGTVQVGAATASGSLGSGPVTDNAALVFDRSDNPDINNVISGSGTLTQASTGTLTLSAVNGYTGATTINAGGTLVIGDPGQLNNGSYGGAIVNNGVFDYDSSAAQSLTGVISGTGALNQNGPGMLTLTAANTYSGGTTIVNDTTLQINSATGAGKGTIADGGILNVNIAAGTLTNTITGAGTVNIIETSGDNLTLGGAMSGFTGVINCPTSPGGAAKAQIISSTVDLTSAATINVASGGTLYIANSTVNIAATVNISGPGNSEGYGAFRIDTSATQSGPVNLQGNTTVGNVSADTGTISGVISDNGQGYGITKVGLAGSTGNIVLSGANTYYGATVVSNGTLSIGAAGSIANSSGIYIAPGAVFNVSALGSGFPLGASQTLANLGLTAGIIDGSVNMSAGSLSLQYTNGAVPLLVTNGTLTLNNNAATITLLSSGLTGGTYPLISGTNGGSVSGSVSSSSVTLNGAGLAGNVGAPTLAISNNTLYLVVPYLPNAAILKQPTPPVQNLLQGASMTWTITATGTAPLAYQWYQESLSSPIAGATNSTFTLDNVTTNVSGLNYFCVVTNASGSATSSSVSLNVLVPSGQYASAVLGDGALAFLRLDEGPNNPPNDGVTAYDIVGAHDGVYSNTILQQPGYTTFDSDDVAAEFGQLQDPYANYLFQDNYVGGINGINFGTPTNTSTNFSVEAWVYLNSDSVAGAGIVAQGWSGAEQFALDTGGTANAFRFYFRNAGGNAITVSPNVAPALSNWCYLTAVLNQSSNLESLYINGVLAATNATGTNAGLLNTNTPILIGARQSSGITNYNLQLNGEVANVAIYPYALTSNQVLNHYSLAGTALVIATEPYPAAQNLLEGESMTWSTTASGTPPIAYQWYQVTAGNTTNEVAGATNSVFTVSNVTTTISGYSYYCVVTNGSGATNTSSVTLNVLTPSSPYVSTILGDDPLAFFRLDEGPNNPPNDGVIAYDIVGAHDGIYSNTILQQTGYSANDPDDVAAEFGALLDPSALYLAQDNYVGSIGGISFATPTNTSTNFTVEAWVYLNANNLGGAGIVAKGYGGAEQFALDTGGTANAFRFYFRNAGGTSTTVSPGIAPALSTWYHLAAVLDQSSNVEYLYTNGALAATTTITPNEGIYNTSVPISIGARTQNSTTNYNLQLMGEVANVALYPYALSGSQVLTHYLGSGVSPFFTVIPTNTTIEQGQSTPAIFYSAVLGTATLTYQWQMISGSYNGPLSNGPSPSGTGAVISGANTATLNISGATTADNGEQYYLTVSNAFGITNSPAATLTVASGPPVLSIDVKSNYTVFGGVTVTLAAYFTGSAPLAYQWTYNGLPLANSARITGATSNVLTIAPAVLNDSGSYQLFVTNSAGYTNSSQTVLTVLPYLTFNGSGAGWGVNSSGSYSSSGYPSANTLELTDGGGAEARSSFYSNAVYVGAFEANFTYEDVLGDGANANGICFVVQNDPRGVAALGAAGGYMGYASTGLITPSVALQLNIYTSYGVGISFGEDGGIVLSNYTSVSPVVLNQGDPINVSLTYEGGVVDVFLRDAINTNLTFALSTNVNIPAIVGTNVAYVGFTGGDGASTAVQTITDFQFISRVGLTAQASGSGIVLSWPAESSIYQLQSNSNLANASGWVNETNAVLVTNNQNQVTAPLPGGAEFFRLQLQ